MVRNKTLLMYYLLVVSNVHVSNSTITKIKLWCVVSRVAVSRKQFEFEPSWHCLIFFECVTFGVLSLGSLKLEASDLQG